MARTFSPKQPVYGQLGCLRTKITYQMSAITIVGRLPAWANVVGGGVQIHTVFNDSGTDTIDVGFSGGGSTDDPDAYATLLAATAVGFIALDELAATTNIIQQVPCNVTVRYNGQNGNSTAGVGYLTVLYTVGANDGSS
jgi:hypothetical protein